MCNVSGNTCNSRRCFAVLASRNRSSEDGMEDEVMSGRALMLLV